MRNLTPRLAKIQYVLLFLWMIAVINACQEIDTTLHDPGFTSEELAEMAAADRFAAANSVYRALALIDELPDNWDKETYVQIGRAHV